MEVRGTVILPLKLVFSGLSLSLFVCLYHCAKVAQKVAKYSGYFLNKIYDQQLSKIVQSGHTGPN